MFHVFHRTWWRREGGKIVPGAGRKTTLARVQSEDIAVRICKEYNESHDPGPLSRKAEYHRV